MFLSNLTGQQGYESNLMKPYEEAIKSAKENITQNANDEGIDTTQWWKGSKVDENQCNHFYKENGENHILRVMESNNGYSMLTNKEFLDEILSEHPKAKGNLYALVGNTEIKLDHFDAFGSQ